jgi:hypothetical protein
LNIGYWQCLLVQTFGTNSVAANCTNFFILSKSCRTDDFSHFYFVDIFPYDPLYSSSPLASLDGFLRSHGDGLYVMQLVVAATNQNVLYKNHMFCSLYSWHYTTINQSFSFSFDNNAPIISRFFCYSDVDMFHLNI